MEKAEPVQVRYFTLRLRDQRSICMWMQDGWKVYMDSYMASNGSCFLVTWTIVKTYLLKVGLTQNHRETMAFRMLTIVDFFYFIMCAYLHEYVFIYWNSVWLRAWSHMASPYTWRSVITLNDFRGVLDGLRTFLGSHNFMVIALGSCAKWALEPWLWESRALEFNLKPLLCDTKIQVCDWWTLKLSVKWKWTMLWKLPHIPMTFKMVVSIAM